MLGPELRQYMFDSDAEGKPFSRSDFSNIVVQGKYLKTVIAFGSKRDFDKPGFYIRNSMFPMQKEEMKVELLPKIKTKRYKTNQLEIELPSGTRPIMIIIPEISNKVASKFRIRNALYEAEATKKANNANIVADRGVKINSKIHLNIVPFSMT